MSQDKVYTLLERLELDIDFAAKEISKELNNNGIYDPTDNWVVLDRAIGGGQIVKPIEEAFIFYQGSANERVFGCEKRKATVQYATDTHNLQGQYEHTGDYNMDNETLLTRFDNISFLPGERNFKLCEVGNYPYNDGSVNNNVIWNKFISDVRASQTDFVGVVVQASFLSQPFKGMAKAVKQDLMALGCYKIIINEYSDFDEKKAKVKTCIVFCRRGYTGLVTYVERSTGRTLQKSLDSPFDMIFDPGQIKFLDELDTARLHSFARFPQYKKWTQDNADNKKLWAIGCYYKTEGFDKNPLKPFTIIEPNSGEKKNYYCVFGSADTKDEAELVLEKLKSFWFNDAVQAALLLTRYQISLDKTQYAKIPKTAIDRVFGANELFDLWSISEDARKAAKELVKNCDYKLKSAKNTDEDVKNN
jgi:hypothetical protein